MKSLHLDLVRVTEAAAISAAKYVGSGDKLSADLAATEAMRDRFNRLGFAAEIAIGEGEKDKSHGLYEGEKLGTFFAKYTKVKPKYEIAVDPIEGTTPTANGGYEAVSVVAMAKTGCFYKTKCFYMDKLSAGPDLIDAKLSIKDSLETTIEKATQCLGRTPEICVLDRPRHKHMVSQLRALGCRIKFISDCDVSACIATCFPESGVDIYMGIGGSPEAVITAAAMKCLRGFFEASLAPDSKEISDKVLSIEDLAKGAVMFAATGITYGRLLKGVRFTKNGTITHSIAMRSESGTIRRFETHHGN